MHPLELSASLKNKWGEILSDYEIIAPFPQAGREIHIMDKKLATQKVLTEYKGVKLAAPTMVFTLEKMGWVRGEGLD